MIATHNLSKKYISKGETVHALRSVSVSVEQGGFIAICGPSGSGKTTLLNIMGCLDTPESGDVVIEDIVISKATRQEQTDFRRRRIGFIFQSYNLVPVLTAYENVVLPLQLLNVNKKECREQAMDILDRVGLASMKDRRPADLSGGQRQRVAIARALVKSPAFILADEPTANLDSATGADIIALMRKLNKENNATFCISTHDPQIIERTKRKVVLQDGAIVEDMQQ